MNKFLFLLIVMIFVACSNEAKKNTLENKIEFKDSLKSVKRFKQKVDRTKYLKIFYSNKLSSKFKISKNLNNIIYKDLNNDGFKNCVFLVDVLNTENKYDEQAIIIFNDDSYEIIRSKLDVFKYPGLINSISKTELPFQISYGINDFGIVYSTNSITEKYYIFYSKDYNRYIILNSKGREVNFQLAQSIVN